jgi:hypothetical protein
MRQPGHGANPLKERQGSGFAEGVNAQSGLMALSRCGKAITRQGQSPLRDWLLLAHDLFGKPLHTFPDHARISKNSGRK